MAGNRLVIVGSMALDDIKTPFGEARDALGGTATYAGIAASLFSDVSLIAVVGADFPREHITFLNKRGIDTRGVKIAPGKTFRWSGVYEYDMAQAHTLKTELNVYVDFFPEIPDGLASSEYVFLANIDPKLQIHVMSKIGGAKFSALDTMNLWIGGSREKLVEAIGKVDAVFINDAEVRQLCKTHNLVKGAKTILGMGPEFVVVKKGEHGALLFSREGVFSAPAFPLEDVVDPTGAGDSFAGGAMGWVTRTGDVSEKNLRKAVIYGSAVASFNAEHFGAGKLKEISLHEVEERVERLCALSRLD
ncbi:putative sugar kinase [uncultured archaeon]|nr:putative sugar kinase [uncultured archaeon]